MCHIGNILSVNLLVCQTGWYTVCGADIIYIFFQFEDLFVPYTKFLLEQGESQYYLKEKQRDNELFRTFIMVTTFNP